MKTLFLTDNLPVLLDDEDYEIIKNMPGWYIQKNNNARTYYVKHDTYGKLHRYLLNITDPLVTVDHIDRNGLNCQKSNLRIVSNSVNKRNSSTLKRNKFHFNGLSYEKGSGNRKDRIKVSYSTDKRLASDNKKFEQKTKSFTIYDKTNINEYIKQAVLFRIEKMREFNYLVDERSEAIETEILNGNDNMEELLNISFNDILGVEQETSVSEMGV